LYWNTKTISKIYFLSLMKRSILTWVIISILILLRYYHRSLGSLKQVDMMWGGSWLFSPIGVKFIGFFFVLNALIFFCSGMCLHISFPMYCLKCLNRVHRFVPRTVHFASGLSFALSTKSPFNCTSVGLASIAELCICPIVTLHFAFIGLVLLWQQTSITSLKILTR
jgi:hypothetical protein